LPPITAKRKKKNLDTYNVGTRNEVKLIRTGKNSLKY